MDGTATDIEMATLLTALRMKGETITEYQASQKLYSFREQRENFKGDSFTAILAYRDNAAMMHYAPKAEGSAVIKPEHFLLNDSGGQYLEGTTDTTRTFAVGPITDEERRDFTNALKGVISLSRQRFLAGSTGSDLDTICRGQIWKEGLNYRCGTGHSVSFVGNVHEGPHALNGRNTTLMRPGMIVTDEPGVYETDLVGIRIENELVCVHKADNQYGTFLGFEPIMFVPIATSPIVPGVLTKDELDWLNNYHRQVFEKLAPRLNDEEREWLAKKCAAIGC